MRGCERLPKKLTNELRVSTRTADARGKQNKPKKGKTKANFQDFVSFNCIFISTGRGITSPTSSLGGEPDRGKQVSSRKEPDPEPGSCKRKDRAKDTKGRMNYDMASQQKAEARTGEIGVIVVKRFFVSLINWKIYKKRKNLIAPCPRRSTRS